MVGTSTNAIWDDSQKKSVTAKPMAHKVLLAGGILKA